MNTYDHHFGPITSISCFPEYILNKPNENSFDDYNQLESFSQLFLTSSFDIIKSKYSIIPNLAKTVITVFLIEFEQQAIL